VHHGCRVGCIARQPRTRVAPEGQQGTTFPLAMTEPRREGKPFTLYVGCTSWGRTAEACSLLKADDLVAMQGKLVWSKRKSCTPWKAFSPKLHTDSVDFQWVGQPLLASEHDVDITTLS
jgi:hypothetical protein